MKNYLVFRGLNYYPDGGMLDFYDDYDELNSAVEYCNNYTLNEATWAHIYSLKDRRIIHVFHTGY